MASTISGPVNARSQLTTGLRGKPEYIDHQIGGIEHWVSNINIIWT